MRGGGNMQQMMKQMQKMQKKMAQEQEKLKEERVAGTAGGGMVTVTVTGHKAYSRLKHPWNVMKYALSRTYIKAYR